MCPCVCASMHTYTRDMKFEHSQWKSQDGVEVSVLATQESLLTGDKGFAFREVKERTVVGFF